MQQTIDSEKIHTKEDFVKFVSTLLRDLKQNPDNWENIKLESYLEALQAWTMSMENYYQNFNLPVPENISWKVFADMLSAAAVYE